MRRRPGLAALLAPVALMIAGGSAFGEPAAEEGSSGRFLVKFKSQGTHALDRCAHCLIALDLPFADALGDRSALLDRLNELHRVRRARGLFMQRHGMNAELARARQTAMRQAAFRRIGRELSADDESELPDLSNVYVFEYDAQASPLTVCADYGSAPHVEYCQADQTYGRQLAPDDPLYHDLWGLRRIEVEAAWPTTRGEGVLVAVVDTGVDYEHPDLVANLWRNPGEIPSNGIDDDGNGFVDDVRGWNFSYDDNDPWDDHRHGTHVSGTIAATGNNGIGVIGVAPGATIMPVKGLAKNGVGNSSTLGPALIYAAMNGARIINNSWGAFSPNFRDPALEESVRVASGLGTLLVFAAGNNSNDTRYFSPQNMAETLAVGASDIDDLTAGFSNTGLDVDVLAPGVGVLSTVPGNRYAVFNGTSMAAPHTAGLAALLLARDDTLTASDLRAILRATAQDLGAPGVDPRTGHGRIHAGRTIGADLPLLVRLASGPSVAAAIPRGDDLTLNGSAAGPGFAYYELSVSPAGDDPLWIPFGRTGLHPVVDGTLGHWNIGAVATGEYYLRLVAQSSDGLVWQQVMRSYVNAPQRLSSNLSDDSEPQIDDQLVVWSGIPPQHTSGDIFLYDTARGHEVRITATEGPDTRPRISGRQIAWQARGVAGFEIRTCEYDVDSGECPSYQIVGNSLLRNSPDVDGRRIIWLDRRVIPSPATYRELRLCELTDAGCSIRTLITGVNSSSRPDMSGDSIVWHSQAGEIRLYDLATETALTIAGHPTLLFERPRIDGARIVWRARNPQSGASAIWLCELDSSRRTCSKQILSQGPHVNHPVVQGNRVVWQQQATLDSPNWDVHVHDLTTRATRRLTDDQAVQDRPVIHGDRVVFRDERFGNYSDISLQTIDPRD